MKREKISKMRVKLVTTLIDGEAAPITVNKNAAKAVFNSVVNTLLKFNSLKKACGTDPVYCVWIGYRKNAWFKDKVFPNGLAVVTISNSRHLRGRKVIFCCIEHEIKNLRINLHVSLDY